MTDERKQKSKGEESSMATTIHERLQYLAQDDIPTDIDLWPQIADSLARKRDAADKRPINFRGVFFPYPQRALALGIVILVCIIALPASVIAAGPSILGRFQRISTQAGIILVEPTAELASSAPTSPQSSPQPSVATPRFVSLDEARSLVNFPVRVPTWLPQGLNLKGVYVSGETSLALSYRQESAPLAGLGVQQSTSAAPQGGYAVPSSAAQAANVSGQPAIYVKGAWNSEGRWDSESDAARISWQQGDVTFVVQYSGLGLSQADLIRIAESLR